MDNTFWRLVLLFFLFWGLVFFAVSEVSLFALGRLRLHKLREQNHPRYAVLESLLSQPHQLIGSILIGNEAVNVAISSLTAALLIGFWDDWAKWITIPVVVFVILLLGEVAPKTLAVRYPEKTAPFVAAPAEKFLRLVWPIHFIIQKIVDLFMKWSENKVDFSQTPLIEKDFRDLVETSHKERTLEEAEKHLIHRVFQFGD